MFNVCVGCGAYNVAKQILPLDTKDEPAMAYAVCPECGYRHPFRRLPLFIVCGASGTGKTAICNELTRVVRNYIPLEGDILWCPAFNSPDDNFRQFFEIWLRMAKNISQSGRPVIFFSAGAGVPENIDRCTERRYFSSVHTLALICEDDILVTRLKKRPVWRNSAFDTFIKEQLSFNQWHKDIGPTLDPPITLLDTSHISLELTVTHLNEWFAHYWSNE